MSKTVQLAVSFTSEEKRAEARALALHLNAPLLLPEEALTFEGLLLSFEPAGLTLKADGMEVRGDFANLLPRLQRQNLQNELLVRATRLKNIEQPYVLDATAGLGEDSFLLAAAGFRVKMFEADPVVAALLRDALERAKADRRLSSIAERMELAEADSIAAMNRGNEHPNVIYLDPMFPERQKSALVKKKFQLIHYLEAPCSTEEELLSAAISARPQRIVIKRPLKAPPLGSVKPSHSISGKSIRYDCIAL